MAKNKDRAKVVTKAIRNAADLWELNNKQIGNILGLSEATISRLRNGKYTLLYGSKNWQLGMLFLRMFRGLDAFLGAHTNNEKSWLNANNHVLNGKPIDLIQEVEGLTHVVQYIDCIRGHS